MKKKKRRKRRRLKKKIRITLWLLLFLSILIIIFSSNQKNDIIITSNLDIEINSDINLLSFIKKSKNYEIITKDKKIDTSTLGPQTLEIIYKDSKKEEKKIFLYN
jgi:hypothetical protein